MVRGREARGVEKEIKHITRSLCAIRLKTVSRIVSLLVTNERSSFKVKCRDARLLANTHTPLLANTHTRVASRKHSYRLLPRMEMKGFYSILLHPCVWAQLVQCSGEGEDSAIVPTLFVRVSQRELARR